ncbi:MAG: hypothetical protein NZ522_06350, partial [Chitinophagales bacterium]|nr:hypothetical protein [Chitinophagales bacterium]
TFIPDFRWDIDKHILEFRSPEGSRGEQFNSLNKAQKGLNFIAKRATYDLLNSILTVEQVPEIIVADSRVIPDSGKVIIEADAKMRTLRNATIISDTISGTHKITKATIDIISKAELRGSGEYKYSTLNTPEQTIVFDDITVKKTTGGKKGKEEEYHLASKGPITDDAKFVLYPNVNFSGEASMYSQNPFMVFKGTARIQYKHPKMSPAEFGFEDTVNPKQLLIHLKPETKDANGTPVIAGISCSKNADEIKLYTNLLNIKENLTDPTLLEAKGIVYHDQKRNEYIFGDKVKILDNYPRGNVMRYNDEKGIVFGEGEFNPAIKIAPLKMRMVGEVINDLNKESYEFNLTLGIDLRTTKDIDEKLSKFLLDDNIDLNDINYDNEKSRKQFFQLCEEKKDDAVIKEFERSGVFKRPNNFSHFLVFTDVNMVFDRQDGTLRSVGKLGLAMAGERAIHKKVDGSIEISMVPGDEHIFIYIRTGTGEWFFLEYRNGIYGLLSSYDVFTTLIGPLMASGKNIVKDEKGAFYRFVIGSAANKADFTERMKEKKNLTGEKSEEPARPRPKPTEPSINIEQPEQPTPETVPSKKKKESPPQESIVPGATTNEPPKEQAKPAGRRQKYTRETQEEQKAPTSTEQNEGNSSSNVETPTQNTDNSQPSSDTPKPSGRRQKYTRELEQPKENQAPALEQPQPEATPKSEPSVNPSPATEGVTTEEIPAESDQKQKKKRKKEVGENPE